jgi:5-methyltetrahydrofolate--homocysteine methyltransferase
MPKTKRNEMKTILQSKDKQVVIERGGPTVLIGERINPTNREKIKAALQEKNFESLREEAFGQIQSGADILDVNVGVPGLNEEALLPEVVQHLSDSMEIPLCIDSANPKALEAALKIYRGKALINSVTGEDKSLEAIMPLVRDYRAAVVGLTINEYGIPKDSLGRLEIARKIVERGEALGIPRADIVIDCIAQPIGATSEAGMVVLEAIGMIRRELEVNMTLGASNLSFGLPDRTLLNNTFLVMAITAGVNCPIVDAAKVRSAVLASDLILGCDQHAARYVRAYKQRRQQGRA